VVFVFDADVSSTFAKIDRFGLLEKLLGKGNLVIPPAVVSDLKRSKSALVKDILKSKVFQHVNLTKKEIDLAKKISERKNLGTGEIECIALCKIRGAVLVTNDNKAIRLAEELSIDVVDLESILYSLKDLIDSQQLKEIIMDIEAKDKVVIANKDRILKNSE